MNINNWPTEVKVTDKECISFLNEISQTPARGSVLTRLSICSDSFGDASGIFSDKDLKTVIKYCPNLVNLDLHRCLSLTEKSLKKIRKLTALKFLSFSCCINTTDKVLESLKENSLIELDLHNCYKITSIGFTVISNFKELKKLLLGNCTGLKDENIVSFFNLPLKHLEITGCEEITDKSLLTILRMKFLEKFIGNSSNSLPKTSYQMRQVLADRYN